MPVSRGSRPAGPQAAARGLPFWRTPLPSATTPFLSSLPPATRQRPSLLDLDTFPARRAVRFLRLLGHNERSDPLQRLETRLAEVPGGPHAPLTGHQYVGDHA